MKQKKIKAICMEMKKYFKTMVEKIYSIHVKK